MNYTWIGHSCFKVETAVGTIVFDPYQDGSVPGYAPVREKANLVLCSHEHGDHNGRDCVDVTEMSERARALLKVERIAAYHDEAKGAKRGGNLITIIDDGEQRAAHFGDLGCELTAEQEEKLKGLDCAMIPVGGYYTIDGKQAAEIIKKIKPKMVIPMHYSNMEKGLGYDVITSEEPFLEALCDAVEVKKIRHAQACSVSGLDEGVIVLQAQNG